MRYLQEFPFDKIKIDKSFIQSMASNADSAAIVRAIAGLGRSLDIESTAEGVETAEQLRLLRSAGCQLAQGFGIARPMPGNELPDWAANWRPDPRWVNVSAIDPVDFPLLYAGVEHRAWVASTAEYLHGRRHTPPTLDAHACRFGSWLDEEASAGRAGRSGFQAIDALHQRLHSFANELFALKAEGREAEAQAELGALRALQDSLLERLQYFVQTL